MKNLRQFENLVIEEHNATSFHQPAHQQNYYEFLYIFEGSGYHYANGRKEDYQKGDAFFVTPKDSHYLEIKDQTNYAVIKFTDRYLLENNFANYGSEVIRRSDLFGFALSLAGDKIRLPEKESKIFFRTIEHILSYKNEKDIAASAFVLFQLLSIFSLIRQFWIKNNLGNNYKASNDNLLIYIHRNIFFPEKLQINHLAGMFSISTKYFSTFFKNSFGISYRQYLINLKVKIIEDRVKSGFTAKQITRELGFTDESHLAHFFKRNTTRTLSEIKSREF
ncbi:hypothetical protein HYN56_22230 [Flavobacterium crocinum]|uniref:HTH araC/xylS-type domain-containing protein n=1 Tax=Flavobacterium crocinum TaxID=2183896 RepID=A0A2S1YRU6_9FLAO|nr:AraC family transcriptional regulator [Flavobacterium crocinum]AWK06799.1 hypothetical protein HYN56_22230 [Flavobacterium crocinum]